MHHINYFLRTIGKYANRVKEDSKPLLNLDIQHFYYFRITDEGNNFVFSSRPEINEYYFENKLYLNGPFLRHPQNFQSGFFFFDDIEKEKYNNSLALVAKSFKYRPVIGLCKREKNYAEFFNFWSDTQDSQNSKYLDPSFLNLLTSYAEHFKKKNQSILYSDAAPHHNLKALIGEKFSKIDPYRKIQEEENLKRMFLNEIGLSSYVRQAELLSNREKQCVQLMLKGKSSKEIAEDLILSPRTVEHYFNHIKNKFNCQFKNEVFTISEKLIELGLI